MIRLALFSSLVLAVAVPAAAETVRVGLILPFSGGASEFGQQIERGMLLYQKKNAAAFGGHSVELIKRDTRGASADTAKTAAQELLTSDGANILAGFVFSPQAIAVAPLASQAKTPAIVMNAATSWIPSLSPYIARVSFTMWQAGSLMGRYAAERLACKTAIVGYTDYPPGKDSLEAFQRAFEENGGKLAEALPMAGPQEVPDFTPFLQRVKDAKPNCFYAFVPSGNHLSALVKTYANLGMAEAGIKLIGPGELVQDTMLPSMDKAAAGMITAFHYAADYDTPANRAFVAAWKQEYGADAIPDFMAVAGWDGMALIAHLTRTLGGKIDGDKAMQAIRGWRFDSPRGPIVIDAETRDIVHDETIQELLLQDGRLRNRVLETYPQVKDPCKEARVGKCATW